MAQNIDIKFRERAESKALNERFRDISGPTILSGYRLALGSEEFSVGLVRAGHKSSIAITPSGAKVEETADVPDAITVEPNELNSGNPRMDSVYLVYTYGTEDAIASYTVVKGIGGTDTPADNPNPNTHLLLGYVKVPPGGAPPVAADLVSLPHGINTLEVANSSTFHGEALFKQRVVFDSPVEFRGGTTGAEDPNSSFIEQLTYPIIAEPGQQEFTLPSPYETHKNALFVFVDGVPQPPSNFHETSSTTFRFHDPLKGNEKVWAKWYRNLAFYTEEDHEHDEYYYRKNEVNNRMPFAQSDYFAGMNGRVIPHFFNTQNYTVTHPIPVEKTADVGQVSIQKNLNEIIVFNTGTYRGQFDLLIYLSHSHQYLPNDEEFGFFSVLASEFDPEANCYKQVDYKRSDGTDYVRTLLESFDSRGYYRRVRIQFFNRAGTNVIKTTMYALDYDEKGLVMSKTLITENA